MAAFEATGDKAYLDMAESIAPLLIGKRATASRWRLPEHFNENWEIDPDYAGRDVFRPYGTTPGHWLEWTRLLLQLWQLGGRRLRPERQVFENPLDPSPPCTPLQRGRGQGEGVPRRSVHRASHDFFTRSKSGDQMGICGHSVPPPVRNAG
jgi:hypothetical protein